ncbi:MAG: D-sedoheptulose 7-phosphate isomerase [Deltaproteobacteria bacterium]|nr:D-sedoheptulose 7-phosphate isomerase [Deltaproteobacteria bacterium]
MNHWEEKITASLRESAEIQLRVSKELARPIATVAEAIVSQLKKGGKVIFFGNGGSAADAQHLAAELIGRFQGERKALPAIALTTDTSILTAIGNDYAFDQIFERQVEGLVGPNDAVVGISTSGHSINVLRGLKKAKDCGALTVAFLGKGGGRIREVVDFPLVIPSDQTSHIQESHITIGHILCGLIEEGLGVNG